MSKLDRWFYYYIGPASIILFIIGHLKVVVGVLPWAPDITYGTLMAATLLFVGTYIVRK